MKMKKWEIALAAGFAAALVFAAPLSVQADIESKMVRLHVMANSDSEADQSLKLAVRDSVLEASKDAKHIDDALLGEMSRAACDTVRKMGYDYEVRVTCEPVWFDTRDYDGFSLAAGTYDAVRVVIGEGKGKNWWCVIFPPLCAAVSEEELKTTAEAAGLSGAELAFISEDGTVCRLGFKIAELWGRLFRK